MTIDKTLALNQSIFNLSSLQIRDDDRLSELMQKGVEIFDLTVGDPLEPTPDFIRQALLDHLPHTCQYPSAHGMIQLREAAAAWLKRRFNVVLNPKTQILSSNGSKEAVFHVPHILINKNPNAANANTQLQRDTIVFSEPAYPVYKAGAILSGGEPLEIPLKESNQYVFDIEDIPKEKISKIAAIWLCYPHNPTGAMINENEASKIYHWALEHGIVILSDECYVDMYFEDQNRPLSFLKIAEKENYKNLLCFFSLSKRSGMTGYRTGFIAGDENLMSIFGKYRLNLGIGTPTFVQHAAISAWNDDAHVYTRNQIFFEKRQLLEKFLTKNNIDFLKSNATFYIWATVPSPFTCSRAFCNRLVSKVGILATPGEAFGPNCKKYFRLALVPTLSDLKKCLSLWQVAIDEGNFL